jgi:hypothetical protein
VHRERRQWQHNVALNGSLPLRRYCVNTLLPSSHVHHIEPWPSKTNWRIGLPTCLACLSGPLSHSRAERLPAWTRLYEFRNDGRPG